ncbi:hydantoin racemase [Pimelobacter sp. 30-1]|nr:hydantoin racemase [Pimelobacter sp. 30-1]
MTPAYDVAIGESLRAEARPDTRLDVASLAGRGPVHLEYNAFELCVAEPSIRAIVWAEQQGYDAAVIGCFYDPFVRAAKEVTNRMPVTAPAEACIRLAQSVGERFSILVGRRKWIPEMEENVHRYGAERNLASFRELGLGVTEFQVDPEVTEKRIREEAIAAVEQDGADVVVLGCTIEFGFYRRLQAEVGVPIIDATVAPLRYAEMLADAAKVQGWTVSSRLGYQSPGPDEPFTIEPLAPVLTEDPR